MMSLERISFGETIRQFRVKNGLLLRQVAADLQIDTALLSKIERSERKLKRDQVNKLAVLMDVPQDDLLVLWLSEKIIELVENEAFGKEALNLSLKNLKCKDLA